MATFRQGVYRPKIFEKYKGKQYPIFRSGWELKFFKWCDNNPNVLAWNSESVVIPYTSPLDNRIHRYFVDFYVKKRMENGKTECALIEIKPKKETIPPKVTNKPTRRYINEVVKWGVNDAKWKAARAYCKDRGWEFEVLTEKELNIKF